MGVWIKRLIDLVGALIGLVLALPILFTLWLLVKAESAGPFLFVQSRLGLNGKPFDMYKIRSMVVGAEQQGTGLNSYSDDPRVTRVGKVMRSSSLDELPQLLNVLKGEMSLVGPRPPVHYELGDYDAMDLRWKSRFAVKPGLTGYAQISGRDHLEWPDKLEYDLRYIVDLKEKGPIVDLVVMLKTILVLLNTDQTTEIRRGGD